MLSDAKIRSLKPKEKAYKVYDDRGLYMVVNPNGSRWWRFKYKYDGRERGISLGVYPDVTLQYAREQLQEARAIDDYIGHPTTLIALKLSPLVFFYVPASFGRRNGAYRPLG